MIKRTLYFGNPAYLSTKDQQLIISFPEPEKEKVTIPIEDIGVTILDHYGVTISQAVIHRLMENNVALITCDDRHMPTGLHMNLSGHTLQQERFSAQLSASEPLKKRLWQQVIKAKITNQAALLEAICTDHDNLLRWAGKVKSGDPDNYEARAAAYYWKNLFRAHTDTFKRGRYEDEPNNMLNYGYAILRAITARSLVGSGLLPTFGIHHHNRYNAYCLADDIMEPYRPMVDELVLSIMDMEDIDIYELSPELKQHLLQLPVVDVMLGKERRPLMIALQQTTASLADCLQGKRDQLKLPSRCKPKA
ncbi:type II CRISPR-associated endonuclease Cas1 [Reichenbachiella carrageenanivorans]|uniref:CRISPR-associated endonuclease Cas1 n=1 Tax=Reichenbachiella carrageenanivorans TaxID=2979869 RepID=A0ABY6D1F2_9BACT|nr:type II CRISPR-associated endonuclease Cas1 [Reichenbachiella carrageenanivorans]UXX79976.1 type II CRISPR-associated endonuclease Cas1 [Reichenbachiella carrageenanivorans]